MRFKFLILFLPLFILSCVAKVCPKPEEALEKVLREPKDGIYYGYIKVNLLRVPVVIEKRGERERVRVGYKGIVIGTDSLCYNGTCFDLPVKPSAIIYGYYPGSYKVKHCGKELVLKSEDGKVITIVKGKLRSVSYRDISLIYGKRSPEGYFRNIMIKINNLKVKLIIEGRKA